MSSVTPQKKKPLPLIRRVEKVDEHRNAVVMTDGVALSCTRVVLRECMKQMQLRGAPPNVGIICCQRGEGTTVSVSTTRRLFNKHLVCSAFGSSVQYSSVEQTRFEYVIRAHPR